MKKDTHNKLSPLSIALHWIVGLTMIFLLFTGIYMSQAEIYSLYPLHKSIGFLILFFVIARVVWRIINGWPTPASEMSSSQQKLAKGVHWLLIIATVLMPVSGMLMSVTGGHGLDLFGLQIFPEFGETDTVN